MKNMRHKTLILFLAVSVGGTQLHSLWLHSLRAESQKAGPKAPLALLKQQAKAKTPNRPPKPPKARIKEASWSGKPRQESATAFHSVPDQFPDQFIEARVRKTLASLKSRPVRPVSPTMTVAEVSVAPSKEPWLQAIYSKNMVDASWATQMLSDKRILAGLLESELGDRARNFYPKTVGLREFLVKYRFLGANGEIVAEGEEIEEALHQEFSSGFVVRPAVGVAPGETARGFFSEPDNFIVEILKPKNPYYSASHFLHPVRSSILGTVASGEAVVIQENVVGSADARKPLRSRFFKEVRVHTYENRVVPGSVPSRWVQTNLPYDAEIARVEAFVSKLLQALPLSLLTHQAWGVDVALMDNGEMRVIEIVTNRGRKIQWSSYLEQPRVLGAYTRHFEERYGLHFSGLSGAIIRRDFANYFAYWEKRIEKAQAGESQIKRLMSYLPPAP
jgi:hypothetical protein